MSLPDQVQRKLQDLPDKPGVYFMRDRQGKIIYVGKAASLRKRVQSYFRSGTLRRAEPKLRGLIHSIADFDFLVVRTEAEAVLTEGRLIKEYRPRYNVSFKDDKRFLLLRVNLADPLPRFEAVRLRREDGATYFGPYASSHAAWAALDFIQKRFGIRPCRPREPGPDDHKHCLNDIVRFCAAPCVARITPTAYRERVAEAVAFLRGERRDVLAEVRQAMEREAQAQRFEKAAALRDTYLLLNRAVRERYRAEKSLALKEADARAGVSELQTALGLARRPTVIEAYDISNISGTFAVASLVCAVEGRPHKPRYRMFRIKTVTGSDDPAMMAEVIRRRFGGSLRAQLPEPDLVLVDGGITQLRAARAELDRLGLTALPAAGLAKQFEEIHYERPDRASPLRLPTDSHALQVLQRIRDEAHRFALTYHRRLRQRRIRESVLDEVAGIGAHRKETLLRHFGSLARLRKATEVEIAAAPGIGPELAREINRILKSENQRVAEE